MLPGAHTERTVRRDCCKLFADLPAASLLRLHDYAAAADARPTTTWQYNRSGSVRPAATCIPTALHCARRAAAGAACRLPRMRQSVRLINRDAVAIKQPQGTHRSTL